MINLEINLDILRQRKLMVCVPAYGGMINATFAQCMTKLELMFKEYNIPMEVSYLQGESLVQRARNYLTDTFIRSDCTHMMFIDADIEFNPQDVLGLLSLQSDDSPYDILCGAYPLKHISWGKVADAVNKGMADEDPNNLINFVSHFVFNPVSSGESFNIYEPTEVSESGTGFMMIRRNTFDRFKEVHPELHYKPDHVYTEHFSGDREIVAYFHTPIDPVNKRYLSEDYFFCHEVRKLGMKVWICPWMRLVHWGQFSYIGSFPALASIGANPTLDTKIIKNKSKKKS
jgi:hypothetical protein